MGLIHKQDEKSQDKEAICFDTVLQSRLWQSFDHIEGQRTSQGP